MTNPEVVYEKTPNGGDYSEFWYLDKTGEVAENMDTATQFKILEKRTDGSLVQTTYGMLGKD
jgi:hypothetical protein